jgi:hypothetical protein
MKSTLRLFSILVLILAFPLTAGAEVSPTYHNFGSIQQGASVGTIITVQNTTPFFLVVNAVTITSGAPDFQISQLPTLPAIINPPNGNDIYSISIGITFSPSGVGGFYGTLVIESNDSTVTVTLEGTGLSSQPLPAPSVDGILAFFDASVADGTLVGSGPGNSATGRRGALRNKIVASGDLIEDGAIADACEQLLDAYQRTDAFPRPPEFVAGEAAPTLAGMILQLMGALGCE